MSSRNSLSPRYYGSTKDKNKNFESGRTTIIDIHSCLDVLFVLLWIFSICARPTIVSSVHLLLFAIYVLFGGILLKQSLAKKVLLIARVQRRNFFNFYPFEKSKSSQHRATKKKKKYLNNVELAELSEVCSTTKCCKHFFFFSSSIHSR